MGENANKLIKIVIHDELSKKEVISKVLKKYTLANQQVVQFFVFQDDWSLRFRLKCIFYCNSVLQCALDKQFISGVTQLCDSGTKHEEKWRKQPDYLSY